MLQPVGQRALRNAEHPGPLRDRSRLSAKLDEAIVGFVVRLLDSSRPSTIAGLVALAVVQTVNACPNGLLPHVGKKLVKRQPSVANRYSRPTVLGVRLVLRIGASLGHSGPRVIGRAQSTAGRMTVLRASGRRRVRPQASAGLRPPIPEHNTVDHLRGPAFAQTEPLRATRFGVCDPLNDGPTTNTCSRQINRAHKRNIINCKRQARRPA